MERGRIVLLYFLVRLLFGCMDNSWNGAGFDWIRLDGFLRERWGKLMVVLVDNGNGSVWDHLENGE